MQKNYKKFFEKSFKKVLTLKDKGAKIENVVERNNKL